MSIDHTGGYPGGQPAAGVPPPQRVPSGSATHASGPEAGAPMAADDLAAIERRVKEHPPGRLLTASRCVPDGEFRQGCVVSDGATVKAAVRVAFEATHRDVPALIAEVRRLTAELERLTAAAHQVFDAMLGQHAAAAHRLDVFAFDEDCEPCQRAAEELDGDLCCESARQWQAEYAAALGVRLPALPDTTSEES